MIPLTISAPSSLLLAGEYAIIEEGGLGLALAPSYRVVLARLPLEGRGSVRMVGLWPGGKLDQTCNLPCTVGSEPSLLEAVLAESTVSPSMRSCLLTCDSGALFFPDGRKRGFGSSAATAAVLAAALGEEAFQTPTKGFLPAVRAHRRFQGGKGSGYDVACSWFGGTGLFRGGQEPDFTPLQLPWLNQVAIFHGPAPVATKKSILGYSAWKNANPGKARDFLSRSNELVSALPAAQSWKEALRALSAYRDLATWIGEQIGSPAVMPAPRSQPTGTFFKASGAGNELGILLSAEPFPKTTEPEPSLGAWQPVPIDYDGVRVRHA